jgi:hypothetical protein
MLKTLCFEDADQPIVRFISPARFAPRITVVAGRSSPDGGRFCLCGPKVDRAGLWHEPLSDVSPDNPAVGVAPRVAVVQ